MPSVQEGLGFGAARGEGSVLHPAAAGSAASYEKGNNDQFPPGP